MNSPATLPVAAVYACLSAVYVLYLPHANPALDDWAILQIFHEARAAGPARALLFFREVLEAARVFCGRVR